MFKSAFVVQLSINFYSKDCHTHEKMQRKKISLKEINPESALRPARPFPLPIVPTRGDEGKERDHEGDNRRRVVS